jgi:hypothetical protein
VRALNISMSVDLRRGDSALWRKAVSGLLLISFFWLSFIAQTHIHGVAAPIAPTFTKSLDFSGKSVEKAPSNNHHDDSDDCPLCQAAAVGAAALVPFLFIEIAVPFHVQFAPDGQAEETRPSYVGHGKQPRAPPTL